MAHICAQLIMFLVDSLSIRMIFMGRAFARNMHGGPDFRHILRKFTGLKEGGRGKYSQYR